MRVVDIEPGAIVVEPRQTRPLGDLDALIASIEDVGLLHPIVVGTDHRLKAGYRRLEAFKRMGRDTIPANLTDDLNDVIRALKAERDENVQREELPPTIAVKRGQELEELLKTPVGRPPSEISVNYANLDQGKTSEKVGRAVGMSASTYEHAKQIVEAAEADPETFGDLPEQMDETSVHAAHQEMKRRQFYETTNARQDVAVTVFSSESNEYYTPAPYVEAARQVMGAIDLDPASCEIAQRTIKASKYYTEQDNGLAQEWTGRVWMNPPYGKVGNESSQGYWARILLEQHEAGNVTEAIFLVKAAVGYEWFETLWDQLPVCFARDRVSFVRADGNDDGQSKQGTAFFYVGQNVQRFIDGFGQFGRVILPENQL